MNEDQRYIDAIGLLQDLRNAQPSNPQASDYAHGILVGLAMASAIVVDQEEVIMPRQISWERANETKKIIEELQKDGEVEKVVNAPGPFIVAALLDIAQSLSVIADIMQANCQTE